MNKGDERGQVMNYWKNVKNKLHNKKIMVSMSLLVLLAGGYLYYAQWQQQTAAMSEKKLPPVKAEQNIVAEGIVLPEEYAALSAMVNGRVANIYVKEGAVVKKGQLLVRFDSRELMAKKNSAQADVEKAKANLTLVSAGARSQEIISKKSIVIQADAVYDGAKADLVRMEALHLQSAVSGQQVDQARTAYRKAEADVEKSRAELDMALAGQRQESIDSAQADVVFAAAKHNEMEVSVSNMEIRAPFDGEISFLEVRQGEQVKEGDVLIRMLKPGKWVIHTEDLTEINIAGVKEGSTAVLTFDALPGVALPGKVLKIRPFGEKKRGDMTYTIYIDPDQYDMRLKWNMTATVTISK